MTTTDLAVLGITICEPIGHIDRIDGSFAVVGSLVVSEHGVEVVPRHGITDADRDRLTAAAGQVFLHGRDGFASEHWRYHPAVGWVVSVAVRDRPAARPARSLCAATLALRTAVIRHRRAVDDRSTR